MKEEQLERICFNCSHFFPSRPEASEYGICLNDDDFEPFIDELLLELNYDCCQDLIQKKEFPGDRDACNLYEEAEIIGFDDDDYDSSTETGFNFLSEEDISMDHKSDEWWNHYWKIDDDKKYHFFKKAIASDVSAGSDPNEDLGEAAVNMFETLLRRKQNGQMIELENFLHSQEHGIPDNDMHYIDYYCLGIHLFNKDIASIKRCLKSFIADPIKSIDLLIPLLDKLNYCGYSEPALQVSQEVYHRIRGADGLIGGAEDDFGRTILMNELQKQYLLKETASLGSREEFLNRLALYDYADADELNSILNYLLNETNCSTLGFQDFKDSRQDFYHALSTSFCKYAFKEKGINFPTAYDIWMGTWDCFSTEATEKNGHLDHFFELDQDSFYEYICDRFGLLSNKKPHAAAVLWGITYVYDFLIINQLISEEIALQALQFISEVKMELIEGQEDSIWEYSFVHSWGRPDSVEEEDFLREKEYFARTFAEIVDVNEYLPAENSISKRRALKKVQYPQTVKYEKPKPGRNESCPCGSGKKYKKCCSR